MNLVCNLFGSSIGRKFIVALTGLVLVLFLAGHLAGNLLVFAGREAFNDYLIQYPGDSRNAEARRQIDSLGGRDLQRSYDIAEFYQKTGKTESAKVYYRDIAARAKSGSLYDKSRARLKELGE